MKTVEQNPAINSHAALEPERYELVAGPAYKFALGRRDFLKLMSGIVVCLAVLPAEAQESGGRRRGQGRGQDQHPLPQVMGAWLHIDADGRITVYTGKAEMGQNIRTSLSQAAAEELRVPVDSVHLVMADTVLTPWDMGTFGSRTTPTMAPQIHRVAAAARELLVDKAAARWKVDRAGLTVAEGKVANPATGKSLSYGELTAGQNLLETIPERPPTTPPTEWKIAGAAVHKVDIRDMVTGRHQYSPDVQRPGMVFGKVLRPERFGATLAALDSTAAEKMPGVKVVRDGDFVGVTAPTEFTAIQALAALKAEWKPPADASSDTSENIFRTFAADLDQELSVKPPDSQVQAALDAGTHKLSADYTIAYIAHTPLEPRTAVAEWNDGGLLVYTGTQRPFGVQSELASAFQIPESKIRVIVPDTGSAYGGKHTGEAAIEAARLAKGAGKPVKLRWTREEEFTWAYFRPSGLIRVRSALGPDGKLTAWEYHNVNSGGAGIDTPYDVPHRDVRFHGVRYPLRQGSYRALAATANHFARESHMDELAHAAGIEPLAFRLNNLTDDRVRAVLQAATSHFGWTAYKAAAGRGIGLACGTEKGSYIATCAEIAVEPGGSVRVLRLVTAFECGAIVNPEQLKNQIEGAAMMGLGGALFEAINFSDGKISNPHLYQYRVPRFGDMPQIEAVLVDRRDLPSAGAGETPLIGVAPAIGNAIFNATGKRLRSMPLVPRGIPA